MNTNWGSAGLTKILKLDLLMHNGNATTEILIEHIKINRNFSEEVTSKEDWHHDL